jgi:hypothetical protein
MSQNSNRVNPDSFYSGRGFYREGDTPLYHSGLTFDQLRAKATGLHFAKDMLNETERAMLAMLEDLLDIVDNPPVQS